MKISIITINYNYAEGLRKTIESVVTQSSHDYEYIVIDGGSTDGSVDVIKEYASQIDYWVSEPDGGIYNAMNKGIAIAKGDYCNFMNSGDVYFDKDVLKNVVCYQKNEDIIYGDIFYSGQGVWPNPDKITMKLFYKHALYHQTCFIRTSLLKEKPYDEAFKIVSDWKWFIETIGLGHASYVHIPLTIVLYEGGGISESNSALGREERSKAWKQLLPETILNDYEDYVYGLTPYRQMFTKIDDIPPFKRIIYFLNVLFLKFVNLKYRSKWIKELPWSLHRKN